MSLTEDERRRYSRSIVLPQLGEAGQQKLLASRVLVVGAGGLGSPLLSYLAAAGIGTLGIIDGDRVEMTNLGRQIAHETADIGRPKPESARDHLLDLNPNITVRTYNERVTAENAASIIKEYDIIADCSDNYPTRFLLSDACKAARKPLISAAVVGLMGQVSTFKPYLNETQPCYRCLVPTTPPRPESCTEAGILGPVAGVLGSLQAVEVIKELLGLGDSIAGSIIFYDGLQAELRKAVLPRNPQCAH